MMILARSISMSLGTERGANFRAVLVREKLNRENSRQAVARSVGGDCEDRENKGDPCEKFHVHGEPPDFVPAGSKTSPHPL